MEVHVESSSASKLNRVKVCLQPENGTAAKVRPVPKPDLHTCFADCHWVSF
jgi:hypothetical protein